MHRTYNKTLGNFMLELVLNRLHPTLTTSNSCAQRVAESILTSSDWRIPVVLPDTDSGAGISDDYSNLS